MTSKILITGISGFIGKNVLRYLINNNDSITAIIRPGTKPQRIEEFVNKIEFAEIDLTDITKLKDYLGKNSFEIIIHIGAVRGGRKLSRSDYFNANVNATEQLVINANDNDSKFIYCSSVGVFGAIPLELPANNETKKQEDNYYHFTKIRAEAIIQNYVLRGLNAAIIRPSITYGTNDFGFPFTLTKLVDKNLLFLPDQEVIIHLASINVISQAFIKLIDFNYKSGSCYNVADSHPVELHKLADFISEQLKGKPYSSKRNIDIKYFNKGEEIAKFFKNELWITRFQLISKHWYYDVVKSYSELGLKASETIPNFEMITDWYKSLKQKT